MNNADNQTSASNNAASNQQSDTNSQRTAEQRAADRRERRKNRESGGSGPNKPDATDRKGRSQVAAYYKKVTSVVNNNPGMSREDLLAMLKKKNFTVEEQYFEPALDLFYDGRISPGNRKVLRASGINWKYLQRVFGSRGTDDPSYGGT